jgi:hypothetical protein
MATARPQFNAFKFNTAQFNAAFDPASPAKNIASIIQDTIHLPFRKLEIKRRQSTDGLYESDWQDITKYVVKWGVLQTSVDDNRLNAFVHTGMQFVVKNDHGEFNPEYEGQSLFYGYLTRYRTMVRVTAGYTDGSGNQFPTEATQGIFIMDSDIDINANRKEVRIPCKSIISPFEETRADEVLGITGSQTSSDIIGKIRDATDGSGNFLFRNFITSTAWDIQTTSAILTGLGTTTAIADLSVWEFMNKLAEIEGYVLYATRTGGIVFADRRPNSDEPSFALYGAGFRRPNVIKMGAYKEATNKLYTHIRFKYSEEDTETSVVTAGTATTVDTRSLEWKYGRKAYEMQNTFFADTGSAQAVASKLRDIFSNLKSELDLDMIYAPNLEILDFVEVSHREGSNTSQYNWDSYVWAADTTTSDPSNVLFWASETSSAVDFYKKNFKIIKRAHNLDTFVTTLKLRESEE